MITLENIMSAKPPFLKRLTGQIIKSIIWPVGRFYAKLLNDKPADRLYSFLSSIVFFYYHNYWPDLNNHKSFSEKIFHRMLHDRRKILTLLSDKLEARNYVANKIGRQYLVPLIGVYSDPEQLQLDLLPAKFVLKANHGCGFVRIIKDKSSIDFNKYKQIMRAWLRTNFCLHRYFGQAWAYKRIPPKIMVEEFLEENGGPPTDYKFYCFSGRVEFILLVYNRFSMHREKHFSRNYIPLDFWNGVEQYPGPFLPPDNLNEMIKLAEILSEGFDFVRIDFYNIKGKIFFGEFTFYPASGLAPFVPREWDFAFGEKWIMDISK